MRPRVYALRCSVMRDSHAKSVKIHHRSCQNPEPVSGFERKLPVAPSLLVKRKGHGRTQPFDPGKMNVTQAAAVPLCLAARNRGVVSCTRSLWQPTGRCRRRRKETLIDRPKTQKRIEQSLLTSSPTSQVNRKFCPKQTRFAIRKFLGASVKKALALDQEKSNKIIFADYVWRVRETRS